MQRSAIPAYSQEKQEISSPEICVYWNGAIRTMEREESCPEALLTKGAFISKIGSLEEIQQAAGKSARWVDLKGCTLLPAFIDGHSHILAYSQSLDFAQLGSAGSPEEVASLLESYIREKHLPPDAFVIGVGYDHTGFDRPVHPDRRLLDACSGGRPVLISHASGHMGVANTKALERFGITRDTPDPEGGKIGREANGDPSGYLEEKAFVERSVSLPGKSLEDRLRNLEKAQQIYLSHGIATVQDGFTSPEDFSLLKQAAERGLLLADIVAYGDLKHRDALLKQTNGYTDGYRNHLRLGGYKLFLDGSPQGKTAWLSRPYEGETYRGYPIYTDDQVRSFTETACRDRRQLLTHCNGDAACEQLLRCWPGKTDLRPVMIHAQTVRIDQLERMKKIGMMPSFFTAHTYYWGDVHRKNLGEERAARISPAASALRLGLPFTFHQDTPVLEPDMLDTVQRAVCRETRSGFVLGADERISVYEALRAVTYWSAYQYFEENRKGTLTEGKLADLVLLDRDPCQVSPSEIRQIQVLETIREGKSIWKKA